MVISAKIVRLVGKASMKRFSAKGVRSQKLLKEFLITSRCCYALICPGRTIPSCLFVSN